MSFSEHILNHTKHTIAIIAAAAALAVLICVLPLLLSVSGDVPAVKVLTAAGDVPAVKVLTAAECVYAADGDGSDDSYITKSGFPDSYLSMLAATFPGLVVEDNGGNLRFNYVEVIPILVAAIRDLAGELGISLESLRSYDVLQELRFHPHSDNVEHPNVVLLRHDELNRTLQQFHCQDRR